MKDPNQEVLRALCIMQAEHPTEYRHIETWLLQSQDSHARVLRNAEQPHLLHRAQGAVGELLELSDIFANAQERAVKAAQKKAGIFPIV